MIRSANSSTARQTLADLNRVTDQLGVVQRQLSSGKRINQPEDDPFGASRALSLRDELGNVQQWQRNIGEATSWLDTSETALNASTNILQRVRELTVQAANGTQDSGGLKAIAAEITQLKETLRGQANVTFAGRYVFSGTTTQTVPYPSPANTYAGNAQGVQRQIADGQNVTVNQSGPTVFGPDGTNVFDALDAIVAHLGSGDRASLGNGDLGALDASMDRVSNARSTVGALSNRLETQLSHLQGQEVNVTDLLSKTEDVDMAKTMITFSQTQSIYQSALQAGAKVIQPSLMDFLR